MGSAALFLALLGMALLGVVWLGAGAYKHVKAKLAQRLMAKAWARELNGEFDVQPWPCTTARTVARLCIPKANVNLYVVADRPQNDLDLGPVWLAGCTSHGAELLIVADRNTHYQFLFNAKTGLRAWLHTRDGKVRSYELRTHAAFAKDCGKLRPHYALFHSTRGNVAMVAI